MLFGLINAPASFQLALDILLSGVKWNFYIVSFNKYIVLRKYEESHIKHVDTILTLPRGSRVSCNLKKSFFKYSADYLGHQTTPGCLHIKTKAQRGTFAGTISKK